MDIYEEDIKFLQLYEEFVSLHLYYLRNPVEGTEELLADLQHCYTYYYKRFSLGFYREENKADLASQNWTDDVDDRYGLQTISGILTEFYVMFRFIALGYGVELVTDKNGQVDEKLDFQLHSDNWKNPVGCQVKSVPDEVGVLKLLRKSEGLAHRMVFVDSTHMLWIDRLHFIMYVDSLRKKDDVLLVRPTSLIELDMKLERENFDYRYGLEEKL